MLAEELCRRCPASPAGATRRRSMDLRSRALSWQGCTTRTRSTRASGVIITGEHVELSTGTGAVHTAPGHGEEDYLVGSEVRPADADARRRQRRVRRGRRPLRGAAGRRRQPRDRRVAREQGLARRRRQDRPQLSALLALQAAGHLPRDRAVVRVDGRDPPARARAARDQRGRVDPGLVGQPHLGAWSPTVPTGASAASARGACRSRCSSARSAARPSRPRRRSTRSSQLFETEGADAWFTKAPREYLPGGHRVPAVRRHRARSRRPTSSTCGGSRACSHTSVLEARPELHRPAEMYLEGSDQHRGWFQSGAAHERRRVRRRALRARCSRTASSSTATAARCPSRSATCISPLDVVAKSGADIVRLWVAAADYGQDVNVSDEILDRTSEAYRRIRNTFRFLLGNLYDFDPARTRWRGTTCPSSTASRWCSSPTSSSASRTPTTSGASTWSTAPSTTTSSPTSRRSTSTCSRTASTRTPPTRVARRSAQTVLAAILGALVRVLAPILTFTCEEVWHFMPEAMRDAESVQLTDWPVARRARAEQAAELRERVRASCSRCATRSPRRSRTRATPGVIGKSQEARGASSQRRRARQLDALRRSRACSPSCSSSRVEVSSSPRRRDAPVDDRHGAPRRARSARAAGTIRELGVDAAHPEVCARCAEVLASVGE